MIDHLIMWGAFAVVLGWPLVVCIAIWFPERAVLAAVLLGAGALTVWMMIAMRAEFVNDGFRMRMKMRKSAESAVLVQLDCGHPLKSAVTLVSTGKHYTNTLLWNPQFVRSVGLGTPWSGLGKQSCATPPKGGYASRFPPRVMP
jgi:hypothetical protein